MARKKKKSIEAFSLSFLDCICCGFGAIVLLLVLSKIYEPVILEKTSEDLEQLIAKLQEELFNIRGETEVMNRALGKVQLETSETRMRMSTLQEELNKVQGQYDLITTDDPLMNIDEGDLRAARQRLTEEMLNLRPFRRTPDDAIGGIPVDSEYVIFVIDTSGSMQAKWGWAEQKLAQVLDVYPRVKGLQNAAVGAVQRQ
jgi:ribosomal protein L29